MPIDHEHIIEQCIKGNKESQRALYNEYKDILFAICMRYMGNTQDAEDVFAEAFVKIFKNLGSFKGEGSFEGWMKRITINEALMQLRKNKITKSHSDLDVVHIGVEEYLDEQLDAEKIIDCMKDLPPGYRTILNLYVLEGFKHREIAEMLGISINTSKSQLILAKKRMIELIKKNLGFNETSVFS